MKYCQHCGAELLDEAVFCPKCGCGTGYKPPVERSSDSETMQLIAKIFMVLACVATGFALIPLCWMVPMTVHYWSCCKNKVAPSTAFKVCTLIFVSLVAGILMLVADDSYSNSDF